MATFCLTKSLLRQYYAAASCMLGAMMLSSCYSWFNPLLASISDGTFIIPMTNEESSWMISVIEIGELLGAIPAGIIINKLGRKLVILSLFPLTLTSWGILLSTKHVIGLYATRILQGVGIGVIYTAGPVYLAEISEPKIRGIISGQYQTMWTFGILYAYVTGAFLSYKLYAYACAALCILFFITFIWAPESPYYLAMKGNKEGCRKSLSWLRATNNIEEEFNSILESLEKEKLDQSHSSWKEIVASKSARKSLLVVSSVCFLKYMTGLPAIVSYISDTMTHTGVTMINPDYMTIVFGAVLFIFCLLSAYLSDLFGRKPLLIFSILVTIISNAFSAMYFYLYNIKVDGISQFSWLIYLSVGVSLIVCSIGSGTLLQTLQGECFSSSTRGIGGGIVTSIGAVTTFIDLKQYQTVSDYFGVYMNYVSFSVFALIGSIPLWSMSETAGKSLDQIQQDSKKITKIIQQNNC